MIAHLCKEKVLASGQAANFSFVWRRNPSDDTSRFANSWKSFWPPGTKNLNITSFKSTSVISYMRLHRVHFEIIFLQFSQNTFTRARFLLKSRSCGRGNVFDIYPKHSHWFTLAQPLLKTPCMISVILVHWYVVFRLVCSVNFIHHEINNSLYIHIITNYTKLHRPLII